MNTISFETDRLFCQPIQKSDAFFILELMNTEDWLANIGDRNVHTQYQAQVYIQHKMISQFEVSGYVTFILTRKTDTIKIGTVGLYNREGIDGIDIGFALLPEHYGKGYAFEACQQLLKLAKEKFKLQTIKAITLPSNKPSQKLLERLGFSFIKETQLPNDPDVLLLYVTTLN